MVISEQEKVRIRNLHRNYSVIKEQNNPFSDYVGAGDGPNWSTAAALWQNWSTGGPPPAPPAAFLNRMANMGCNGKTSRYNHLLNKFTNLFPSGGGSTINSNNPMWQSTLASKIFWLQNDTDLNC